MDQIEKIVGSELYHNAHPNYIVGMAEVMMRYDNANQVCKVGKPCVSESGQVVCIPKRHKCSTSDENRERNTIQAQDLKEILKTAALAGAAGVGLSALIGARNARVSDLEMPYEDRERVGYNNEADDTTFNNIIKKPATALGTAIGAGVLAGTSAVTSSLLKKLQRDVMANTATNIQNVYTSVRDRTYQSAQPEPTDGSSDRQGQAVSTAQSTTEAKPETLDKTSDRQEQAVPTAQSTTETKSEPLDRTSDQQEQVVSTAQSTAEAKPEPTGETSDRQKQEIVKVPSVENETASQGYNPQQKVEENNADIPSNDRSNKSVKDAEAQDKQSEEKLPETEGGTEGANLESPAVESKASRRRRKPRSRSRSKSRTQQTPRQDSIASKNLKGVLFA